MPPLKNIKQMNTQVVTGRKVLNAIRSLEDPQGSSVSQIRKCVASRLHLDILPDLEELKVLLDDAVNRGALMKLGRKYKILGNEKDKKITGKIAKRVRSDKRDVRSKLPKKIKLGVKSSQISQRLSVRKRCIPKVMKKEMCTKVTGEVKKRKRTGKSGANSKLAKMQSQDAEEGDVNSEEIHQSQQMPASEIAEEGDVNSEEIHQSQQMPASEIAKEEKSKTDVGEKSKHQSTEQNVAKRKLAKKIKLYANKADVHPDYINQPHSVPEEERSENDTGEVKKRQRAEKIQQKSKKILSKKRSRSSKKMDANSEDSAQHQTIPERDDVTAASLNDM